MFQNHLLPLEVSRLYNLHAHQDSPCKKRLARSNKAFYVAELLGSTFGFSWMMRSLKQFELWLYLAICSLFHSSQHKDAEGCHQKLNRSANKINLPFDLSISPLYCEAQAVPKKVKLVKEKTPNQHRRKKKWISFMTPRVPLGWKHSEMYASVRFAIPYM